MSPTSTKTRPPEHSAGWRAMRIITDLAGKGYKPGPADWLKAKHRNHTREEYGQIIDYRLHRIITAATLTTRA